uniref:Uncharacterized protein n=1 Tax=Lotus japonicus TaxID=34305 RepID=I3SJW2_LOTJA|nr:unknown [Lotus japonicus]
MCLHFAATSARAIVDEPPSLIALPAAFFKSSILLLISTPSSPSIKPFTTLAISPLSTNPPSLTFGLNATFRPPDNNVAFKLCSAKSGHAITGTPWTTLSSTEFQPQCDKNPPVEPCPST